MNDTKINQAIELTREFIKQKPYRGTYSEKYAKFVWYLEGLCEIYSYRPVPKLIVPKRPSKYLMEHYGFVRIYNRKSRLSILIYKIKRLLRIREFIAMRKFSIITLLHEFKHLLDARAGLPQSEESARQFSEKIFFTANPHAKKTLVKIGHVWVPRRSVIIPIVNNYIVTMNHHTIGGVTIRAPDGKIIGLYVSSSVVNKDKIVREIIRQGIMHYREQYPNSTRIYVIIRFNDIETIQLFESLGFKFSRQTNKKAGQWSKKIR